MADPAPLPPPQGYGKSLAAIAAGAVSTIVIYIIDAVLKAKGIGALPADIVAAVQTLITTGAVYLTPHNLGSG